MKTGEGLPAERGWGSVAGVSGATGMQLGVMRDGMEEGAEDSPMSPARDAALCPGEGHVGERESCVAHSGHEMDGQSRGEGPAEVMAVI